MKRRNFISNASVSILGLPFTKIQFGSGKKLVGKDALNFGIVADVHHGMIPDTMLRLESFLEKARDRNVDFIIQLGDFCHGEKRVDLFFHFGKNTRILNIMSWAIMIWTLPQSRKSWTSGVWKNHITPF